MLEIGRNTPVGFLSRSLTQKLSRSHVDALDLSKIEAAPQVQLLHRDAFVAEVAIKLDRMHHELKGLGRDVDLLKSDMAELRDVVERNGRLESFQEKEQRLRAQRLDEVARRLGLLTDRVEALDLSGGAPRAHGGISALEALTQRVAEIEGLKRKLHDVEWRLSTSAGLFCASVAVWFVIALFV